MAFGHDSTSDEVVSSFPKQVQGKTIVITGASANGLGAQTAISLARGSPSHLILLGRSQHKVQSVIKEIQSISPTTKTDFVPVELDKLSSVREAAKTINDTTEQIDILINNAGIMAVPFKLSADGIESQLATNHVGHFEFTNLLLPKLVAAAGRGNDDVTIVNVSSDGYHLSKFRFDDYNFSDGKDYHEWSGYGQSKTANILFTRYLATHLAKKRITSFAVHPGVNMNTGLSNHMGDGKLFECLNDIAQTNTGYTFKMGKPKETSQGAAGIVRAALDPALAQDSGAYLEDCNVVPAEEWATSQENSEKLWRLSEELVGAKYDLSKF